jgi:hypothetical protein
LPVFVLTGSFGRGRYSYEGWSTELKTLPSQPDSLTSFRSGFDDLFTFCTKFQPFCI